MSRQARHLRGNGIYHVLNRGNCGMDLFGKAGDFRFFIKLLKEGRRRCSMRMDGVGHCPPHWNAGSVSV